MSKALKNIFMTVYLLVTGVSAMALDVDLKSFDGKQGIGSQNISRFNYEIKDVHCEVGVLNDAVLIATYFNLPPNVDQNKIIHADVMLLDERMNSELQKDGSIKYSRSEKTPESFCGEYEARSPEVDYEMTVGDHQIEIKTSYTCYPFLFPIAGRDQVDKTICKF